VESVPEPRTNKSVVFEDFFTMGLRMPPPSSSCRDSAKKIKVQLHQVMPNTIVQIRKFIWAISFCGGRMTANVADVFTMHYELHYQQKKITKFWVHYFPP
jgi:hypothetical protein